MYDLPEVAHNNDELWRTMAGELSCAGFDNVPDSLDRETATVELWVAEDLLISQTCGYPLTHALAGRVRVVATPCYDAPGCDGPNYCSIVMSRTDGPHSIDQLRGCRAAYNSTDSQSGYAAFRALIAPHANGGRVFSATVETGSHAASLQAVQAGRADVCAIDAVTLELLRRHRPGAVQGLTEIARTPAAPGLPLITSASATDETVTAIRSALNRVIDRHDLAVHRNALLLRDFAVLNDDAYRQILDMEQHCLDLGYPRLA